MTNSPIIPKEVIKPIACKIGFLLPPKNTYYGVFLKRKEN